MSELKPCPFCGDEAKTWADRTDFYVACYKCHIDMSSGKPAEVIEAWNRRAQPAQAGQDFTEQLREVARRAGTPTDHACDCGRKWKHTTYGWASTQPAQAGQVLTDDRLLAMWEGTDGERALRPTLGKNRILSFARAIEQAVLAKRVPMTNAQIDESMRAKFYPARNRAFIDGVEAAERHHGIGGEKGGV